MWTLHDSFFPLVREVWGQHAPGDPVRCLLLKIRRLKVRLWNWNRVVFWNVFDEIQHATTELDEIQWAIADNGDNEEHFELEMS